MVAVHEPAVTVETFATSPDRAAASPAIDPGGSDGGAAAHADATDVTATQVAARTDATATHAATAQVAAPPLKWPPPLMPPALDPANLCNKIRTHRSLDKDAPISRPVQRIGNITSHALLGGLHHQYVRI
jgi:hypothetical protein